MQWLLGRSLPPADQHLDRLQKVLRTAIAKTRYAREYNADAERFEELPRVDLLEFLCHTERYAVPNVKPLRERLLYPLGDAPRTAVIARKVTETRRVRCFSGLQSEKLAAFAPKSLAAPLDAFRAAGNEPLPHAALRNAVIVFTGILEGPLMPEDADRFWRRYQVPVFEQFLGLDGELLAWECEIHHGLHVRQEAAHFECGQMDSLQVSFLANPRLPLLRLRTGLTGRLVMEPCPCGEKSPRLVDLRRRTLKRAELAGAAPLAAAG